MLDLEIEITDQMCSTVLFLPEIGNVTAEEAQRETERMDSTDNDRLIFLRSMKPQKHFQFYRLQFQGSF